MRLTAAALTQLGPAAPQYDRSAVTPGIVHVGVGGFHRSHEAAYVDRLLAAGARAWGICGVGTQPGDARMRDVLRAQDHLYSLVLKHPDGRVEPRVIGSLVDHLHAPDDLDAVVERMAAPSTHVVSLTITEGGYQPDASAGPGSVFSLVVEALARRRGRGLRPFTVLSCDNVQHNGDVARAAFAAYAAERDAGLGAWVRDEVAFPSSMVDRITPVTTDDDRALVRDALGVDDAWPVVCEPYTQWVLEDAFSDGRPAWEDVGVQLVDDVAPYEQMKLRLLNAGHQAIAYLGCLAGHRYTDEVCRDPAFRAFLLGYLEHEATPTLAPVPGVDLVAYRLSLLERFGNPHVRDTLARLCAETSDRIPTFLLPVVRDALARGLRVDRAALAVAGWARYARGVDEQGQPIQVVDRLRERVQSAAGDPATFLVGTGLFGDLADHPGFVRAYLEQHEVLRTHGAAVAVARLGEVA